MGFARPNREPLADRGRNAGSSSSPSLKILPMSLPKLEATPELMEELSEASRALEEATPQEILRWAVDRFAPRFTMATAFGPEGMVLIHMLSEIAPDTPLFNLDTGYQFAETLELRERVLERYGMAVELKRPETTVEQYEQLHGGPVYKSNPTQCCYDRKLVVLRQAVEGMVAWASAIRRDQSPDRAQAPIVGWDKKFQLVKVSPLANWTKREVWDLIMKHDIPYNPLHDQGYASIGCQPCTRAILFGEDERAGRWSGFAKTECGLHSLDTPSSPDTKSIGSASDADIRPLSD
jgi:phosphoadenosine phosphosulfate reductase